MENIISDIKKCFSIETCYHGDREKWTPDNPTTGHCAIASLLLQSIYGGTVCKTTVNRHTHYFNYFEDKVVDITAEQFGNVKINYDKYIICNPKNMLKNKDVKERYNKLLETFQTTQGG